jgi:toxin ParE1/3/4
MRLVWRPMALADREAIMEFVAAENPAAAIALDDQFEAKAEQARQRPSIYRPGRVKGTREIVVRPNYVMIYAVENEPSKVVVLRVLHTARQWPL